MSNSPAPNAMYNIMPMTHIPEICAVNRYQKTSSGFRARLSCSLVPNFCSTAVPQRIGQCSVFVPVYGNGVTAYLTIGLSLPGITTGVHMCSRKLRTNTNPNLKCELKH